MGARLSLPRELYILFLKIKNAEIKTQSAGRPTCSSRSKPKIVLQPAQTSYRHLAAWKIVHNYQDWSCVGALVNALLIYCWGIFFASWYTST